MRGNTPPKNPFRLLTLPFILSSFPSIVPAAYFLVGVLVLVVGGFAGVDSLLGLSENLQPQQFQPFTPILGPSPSFVPSWLSPFPLFGSLLSSLLSFAQSSFYLGFSGNF